MGWGDFIRLFRMLFGSKDPELDEIQKLGLLAVKIGQVFALRIDFLGAEKCRKLSGLYSRQNKLPPQQFQALIAQNGGVEFLSQFAEFNSSPLAVASVGQVHRAKLKNGEDVVVKLVKKDLRRSFEKDIARGEFILRIGQYAYPKLRGVANPLSLVHEIREMTLNELDLRNETKGHDLLRSLYLESNTQYDLSKLCFANLYRDLSTETVLVKEFVPGNTFDELLTAGKLQYSTLLDLFHIHGFYMFVKGTFHGDIHPGNVILNGNKIYFIDTGFIGRVTDRIRINLFHFFDALSQYQYEESAHYLHAMSSVKIDEKRYAVFESKFVSLYSDFTRMPVGKVSLTRKMMDTIKLGVRSGMEFEEGMFDIIKSLMYMDGMVLRANPDAILLEDMRSFIQEFRKEIA
jgi:ubiquinone biosynthesis protein